MTEEIVLTVASETAEQARFSLVSIDLSTIVFTLINTLIIVFLYFKFLHKPVCQMLDKRAETVNKDMDDANKAKEEAQAVKAEYEQRLQSSKEEAEKILTEANRRASQREEEIIAQANEEAARVKMQAEQAIEREKKRAVNEIKEEISDMVVMAAGKVAQKEISAQDNEEIINSVLAQIGEEN